MAVGRRVSHVGGWRREWGLLLLLTLLTLPLFTPRLYASDEIKYFAVLRSVYFDHDLHYANEYGHFLAQDPVAHAGLQGLYETVTSTGHRLNSAPIGSALLWAPFYIAADMGVKAARWWGSTVPRDGYSWPYVFAVCLGSLVWGTTGIFLSYRLCREYAGTSSAKAAILGVWLASSVVFYLYVTPPMAHANSLFAVALYLFLWLQTRERRSLLEWGLLGATAGLMVLVRELNWLFLLALAVDEASGLWVAWRDRRAEQALTPGGVTAGLWERSAGRQRVVGYFAFVATLALVATPQFIAYRTLHGTFAPAPFVVAKFSWFPWHAGAVLFSGFHGLFSWTPIALFGVLGLIILGRRDARLALALALVFVAQVLAIGSYETWWGGASFGARRFINCTPIFALGLAAMLEALRPAGRRLAAFGIVALVLWNLALGVQYGTGMIPRDQPVKMTALAYNQLFEVPPRLAGILWRFVTDRASFYRTRS